MKKRHSAEQIVLLLREADEELGKGEKGPEAFRKLGITQLTYYRWRTKYGSMEPKLANQAVDQIRRTENKELLRDFWNHDRISEANAFFDDWFKRVIRTNLTPLKKVACTIKEQLSNVLNYCLVEITNAVAEGFSGKITSITHRVGGFRNREDVKTAILFYCGGLDLQPR